MREILAGRLWIGNEADARNTDELLRLGVGAVVDLAMEETPLALPREIVYCRFPLVDGLGNPPEVIHAAIDVTASFIESQLPTLVTCGGGSSRSPAIAAAAFAQAEAISLEDGLRSVTGATSHDVSTSLWSQIKNAWETRAANRNAKRGER
jgi:protein-tyrosine phosphatase